MLQVLLLKQQPTHNMHPLQQLFIAPLKHRQQLCVVVVRNLTSLLLCVKRYCLLFTAFRVRVCQNCLSDVCIHRITIGRDPQSLFEFSFECFARNIFVASYRLRRCPCHRKRLRPTKREKHPMHPLRLSTNQNRPWMRSAWTPVATLSCGYMRSRAPNKMPSPT